ncbi:shikimate kinase [Luteimonas chenhongjianii]|uniref:Shikimate kinase n=1 Tax=Luteimonas chenhongjianii TaxID=2006110 RepID=A0A290XH20_9GAMM|nr:shikimate kinase [Luteimonas chenhongjianii]ATD68318.1 shikimate kinase [Luteimonas chenhongjianii]
MHSAPNLVLVGPMGAGKSSIGRRIAARFGLAFVDIDQEIEQRTGARISMIFECEGEAGFRARERATLADILVGSRQVIATGGGAVLDPGNRSLLRARGFVVHMHADIDTQLTRLARDRTRPLLAGDNPVEVLRRLAAERAPLYAECAHLRFDTGPHACNEATAQLGHLIETHWQPPADPDASVVASAGAASSPVP